jgi:hypothetical protein
MEVQREPKGRVVRATEVLSAKSVTKTATVDNATGDNPGRIDSALFRTNVTTRLKNARRFEITVRGLDHRDKARRIKKVLTVGEGATPDKAYRYMVYGIIQALRQRGYRTQYKLEDATFTYRQWGISKSRTMKQLHDVTITVKVFKR